MRRALYLVGFLAVAVPVSAQPVIVRLGTHAGFGRVVLDFGIVQGFTSERTANGVILHVPGVGLIPAGDGSARNVTYVEGGTDTVTLKMVPDARIRISRLGTRIVVDVMDAPPARHPPPAALAPVPAATGPMPHEATDTPDPAAPKHVSSTHAGEDDAGRDRPAASSRPPTGAKQPVATPQPTKVPAVKSPIANPPGAKPTEAKSSGTAAPVTTAPHPAEPGTPTPILAPTLVLDHPETISDRPHGEPVTPPRAPLPAEPISLAVATLPAPAGTRGSVALVPFGPDVGAASFRHGDQAWIVFDERRPLDVTALGRDPTFTGAEVELLPSATLLRLKVDATAFLRLERRADGWALASAAATAGAGSAMPVIQAGRMILPFAASAQVVAVPDPETGRNLLVGTIKLSGPGIPVGVRVPEFAIVPSWQGAVVDPVSDHTTMRPVPDGFALQTGSEFSPAPENGAALAKAAVLTRRFDFPTEPVPALLRRLQAQVQDIGRAPAQSRLASRKAAAQTMLALGLAAEAQSMLQVAAADDPRAAGDPDLNGLAGVAALLNGRPDEAGGLDVPELTGSDEVGLWRAVRSAIQKEGSAEAAPVFAAVSGLVLAYPTALRNRLLPLVADDLALGGASQAADALLGRLPNEPLLAFARAVRLEQKGDAKAALAVYDALTEGRDRLSAARAATRAILLRLNTGEITQAEAASRLELCFAGWRGDARERDLRRMTAETQAKAGLWRKAFETLRETAQLFPADAPAITARLTSMIGDLLRGADGAAMKPLDFVALAAENVDSIAKSDQPGMTVLIADKLLALDLPKRADPIMEQLIAASPPGATKAALGSRLAQLRLEEGDPAGATAALTATASPDLPHDLDVERGLSEARIAALAHDIATASAVLSRIGGQEADELRATILGDSGDWHGASFALRAAVDRAIPDEGALSPAQQDLLLRLASAQSRAQDSQALHDIGLKQGPRMTGPRADLFRLLTEEPVKVMGDVRRVSGDIAIARAMPSALNAVGGNR